MALVFPTLQAVGEAARVLGGQPGTHVEIVGPWGSGKSLLAVQLAQARGASLLIAASSRADADAIYEDLCSFLPGEQCLQFPAWEVLPTDSMEPADDIVAERMNALMRLSEALERSTPVACVAPVQSLVQRVAPHSRIQEQSLTLRVGDEQEIDALLLKLTDMGYERELMVERRGQMSLRGGIFDIFPIASELPLRIEFFGDEIESMRRFEPETQRSVGRAGQVRILPRSEKQLLQEGAGGPGLGTLLEYLPDSALLVLDEPARLAEEAEALSRLHADSRYFIPWSELQQAFEAFSCVSLAQVAPGGPGQLPRIAAPMRSITGWERDRQAFWDQLTRWDADGYRVRIFCANAGERRRLHELLEEQGHRLGQDAFDLRLELGRLRGGFASPADKLTVLSEREMFGRHYVRRQRRRFEAGAAITSFDDFRAGDYIVHARHGIGRYLGLRRFEGKAGDFLALQYLGGDRLYLPVTHIDEVQKYQASEGAAPRIDKLGGSTWARKKARVKKAVRDMTEELLKLYAAREARDGHAFSKDTHWQGEFEDAFEYEETPDQARAILEVKRDMEFPRPMERLLCGDVGFGKTEVAIRAAFKAVMDGKQVAVLAPTTVLAEQHYQTFLQRMADYPVTVEMLSRFRSPGQQKITIERLQSGEVDIVIGTHRLTSKDIKFKDLGLVVIDEEQRFGVAQKEKLKHLRNTVDVLTMSATPIPRTLNLALLGARDMSVINTAPNDRLPVHTCIEQFDEQLIREAIERELAREGQVFFLHNRVQTIMSYATLVRKLVPLARVAVAHGQMHENELERIMSAFVRREIDVLVCTTIIGSGIDIPNANTIIITNATNFGLAELYQLRGRVGRYKHRAFAYLLVPGDRALSEVAQQRLKALEEFSTLGSGFRVALRDLEIRGCGNILGGEQHGHIVSVGFEAYTNLLEEAISELKGEPAQHRALPPFDVAADAHIPGDYVPSETQKITLYKRIGGARSVEEVDELEDEITDRFGRAPAPVRRLLEIMRLRALGGEAGARRLSATRDAVIIEFDTGRHLSRKARTSLEHEFAGRLVFAWQDQPSITFKFAEGSEPLAAARHILRALTAL
ncbi:MAG TPA: transcription-repair coupling factor [Candidatus Hydrogenedentes bacterium]|jgi:transcription-repair coupling factor (superfamily II helicase)|nr:transcription-repair coupling factor [Candidatus Hydrogenedentota bacterium]